MSRNTEYTKLRMITEKLHKGIAESLKKLAHEGGRDVDSSSAPTIVLEHPADPTHGDYSTSVALAYSKLLGKAPRVIAESVAADLTKYCAKHLKKDVASVSIAGPGFINITCTPYFFAQEIKRILKEGKKFGLNKKLSGKKVIIDYTNPNPFKTFHIGHLMANAIGESISRLIEARGAHVIRVNYQGDAGLHVAKAVWGMLQNEAEFPHKDSSLTEMIAYINKGYVTGSAVYEADAPSGATTAREEIVLINKMIFERTNPKLMRIYNWGRKVSLLNFDVIYKKLGTKFDHYFFESEVAGDGIIMVKDFVKRGVFAESNGAIVFQGEKYGLHTRVFITSQGLPTYEAKEVGLTRIKFDKFNPDQSIVVTANEQDDYFKVVTKALSLMFPYMSDKMLHVSHGMMRFANGKMSSRKGNVIGGETLLADVAELVKEKMKDREFSPEQLGHVVTDVSVGAIKYSILKQSLGGDIVYDFDKSISFEGDSGPYLQYSCVRARSILAKASEAKIKANIKVKAVKNVAGNPDLASLSLLERLVYRYPEVVERAGGAHEPHHLVTYLIELASSFNSYYALNTIVDKKDPQAPYRVALTLAFVTVMTNGLGLLGIRVPEKM